MLVLEVSFMNQEKIGRFIAQKRKEKGMTQEKLAEKLGVSFKTISKWERGRCMPDHSLILSLCEELEISVNELMNGEENISDETTLELLRRVEALERQRRLFEAVLLVLLGLVLTIVSDFVSGSIIRDFVSGAMLGMGVGTIAIGIVFVILRLNNDPNK